MEVYPNSLCYAINANVLKSSINHSFSYKRFRHNVVCLAGRVRTVASSVDPEALVAQVWQLKRDLRRRETQLNETQARCRHLEEDAVRQDHHLKQL